MRHNDFTPSSDKTEVSDQNHAALAEENVQLKKEKKEERLVWVAVTFMLFFALIATTSISAVSIVCLFFMGLAVIIYLGRIWDVQHVEVALDKAMHVIHQMRIKKPPAG